MTAENLPWSYNLLTYAGHLNTIRGVTHLLATLLLLLKQQHLKVLYTPSKFQYHYSMAHKVPKVHME